MKAARAGSSSWSHRWLVLLLVVSLAVSRTAAYPELFVTANHANSCTAQPAEALGDHGAPVPDRSTTFKLTKAGATKPETTVCPGVAYSLVVDYGTARRRTFITSSAGKFQSQGALPADATCANRAASGSGSSTYSNTLTLPCDAKGQLVLNVTSAGGRTDDFHASSARFPINAVANCPASTCPGAPPAAKRAAAAAAAAAPAAADAATDTKPAAAAAAASKAAAGSSCQASPYKYACAVNARDGATLHYTLSDSPQPPENVCTQSAAAAAAGGQQQQQYLHLLLDAPVQGYAGVAFPKTEGQMAPADAVISWVDAANGQPQVSAYHLVNYSPAKSATNNNGLGWATNMGAAKPTPGRTLLCFSRAVDAPDAQVVKKLDASALKLNWVGDGSTAFSGRHELTNSLTLDTVAGAVSSSSSKSKLQAQLAHGALMLLAFAVFMPAGALMARHKWIMGDAAKGGIRPAWFHAHRGIQCLAVLLALAGFILALASFDQPWSNMSADSTAHSLYNGHRVLGVIVIALTCLQVVGGIMRPGLTHKRRWGWRMGHTTTGWLALGAGAVVMFLGAVMMHDMAGAPYINWLLPLCLFLGLAVIAAVLGEVLKLKLQGQGRYNPDTHTYSAVKGTPIGTPGYVSGSSSLANMVEITDRKDKTGPAAAQL